MTALPRSGTLLETPLPQLLLALGSEAFSGHLTLTRERTEKVLGMRGGTPVYATSNLASDSLTRLLIRQQTIPADAEERVLETMKARSCKEESALLQLKLIGPKELLHALREQVRRRILDCFAWPDGTYSTDASAPPGAESDPFRVGLLALVRDGIATHWPADRLLTALAGELDRFPSMGESYPAAAASLGADAPAAAAVIAALDSARRTGAALGGGPNPVALATLWVLSHCGALSFRDTEDEADEAAAAEADAAPVDEPQIEIEIIGKAGASATATGSVSHPAPPSPAPAGPASTAPSSGKAPRAGREERAEAMRKEVLAKHGGLGELDHYEMLDIARDVAAADVKKAYLQAAKRFHPDALTRLGLDDLKTEANEAFARIAEAYEVLSDPERRSSYDANSDGEPELDVERLAQAEKLYRKGEILLRGGSFNAAVDFFEGAVAIWPDDPVYQSSLGWTLYKKNPPEFDRAVEHLELSLEIDAADDGVRQKLETVRKARGR